MQDITTQEEARNRSFPDLVIHYRVDAPRWNKDSYDYPKARCGAREAGYATKEKGLITCMKCRRFA